MTKNLEALKKETPFDQFSRQYQVAELLNDLRKENQTFKILDVGGYKGKTAEFLPKDEVWVLDVFDVKEKNYIKGDGTKLPFEDGNFDFVVSFDVLEHIPESLREKFIDEANRVAKIAMIICAPQRTPENEFSEHSLNELHKQLHKKDHPWLKEHIEYVLPDFEKVEKNIKDKGLYTLQLPSNDTTLWFLMQGAIFLNSKYPMGAPKILEINEFYNKNFLYDGGADINNTYRIILCASKDKNVIKDLSSHFKKKNSPLNLKERLELIQRIHAYELTLAKKMHEHSENLKGMYEHERIRAEQLHKNSIKLLEELSKAKEAKGQGVRKHISKALHVRNDRAAKKDKKE